jgi:hypothetical protein
MGNIFKKFIWPFLIPVVDRIDSRIDKNRILTAQILINSMKTSGMRPEQLSDTEFRVFSQWGEDGIIQYLISRVPIENEVFVEFGVEDYRESNSRFLLMNNNWSGLIIDSDQDYIRQIRSRDIYDLYDLTAVNAFITKDNINELIQSAGIKGDIGLLSIDIDGNDYWVWDSINIISPRIVICEYNSLFGPKESVTIPYSENFYRTSANYSNLYFGSSLKALCTLAERKGYIFAGSNKAGSNAFFVRKDVAGNIPAVECGKGYRKSKMRESRDSLGNKTYVSGDDRIRLIAGEKVIDITTGRTILIRDLNI